MKKFMFILVTIIVASLFISLTSMVSINHASADSRCTETEHNVSKACYCPRCDVQLRESQEEYTEWVNCWNCGGDGLVTGVEKDGENCYNCKGTGLVNNKTAYCSLCGGDGYRDVQRSDWKKCTSCNGEGGQNKTKRRWVLRCPTCRQEYSGC
jgi:DnaJ-class molecular chaperone